MNSKVSRIFCGLLTLVLVVSICPTVAAVDVSPHPKPYYAKEFIKKCDGQQWFINEVERQLKMVGKTIDNADGPAYFSNIVRLDFPYQTILVGPVPELPQAVGQLTALEYIKFNSFLAGAIPSALENLTKLTYLDLSGNKLSGSIPPQLGKLAKLTYLNLSGNNVSGRTPPELGSLTDLAELYLSYNHLCGAIPPELGNLTKLTELKLEHNVLSGTIPSELGKLASLKELWLNNNCLIGTIPSELGNLKAIEYLVLRNNMLSGEIPLKLGKLKNLVGLDMSTNCLSGAIPPELGDLTSLEGLSLRRNYLGGAIPSELGKLAKLGSLSLGYNDLSGEIPGFVGANAALTSVFLENNNLVGHFPEMGKEKRTYEYLDFHLENNYLADCESCTPFHPEYPEAYYDVQGNFSDTVQDEQLRMYLPKIIQIDRNAAGNIHTLIKFVEAESTGRERKKTVLSPTGYTCTVVSGSKDSVDIQIDTKGIWVKPLVDIPRTAPILLEVRIRHNEGSEYSCARVELITETTTGGGRGEVTIIDPGVLPVRFVKHAGYIDGYPDRTFRPEATATRAEFVTMLEHSVYLWTPEFADGIFLDITGHWAEDSIWLAWSLGWVYGDSDGKFRPDEPITRAEAVTILYRALRLHDAATTKMFSDINRHWAERYISAVAERGQLTGYPDGSFRPNRPITRAEAVHMINAILNRNVNEETISKYKYKVTFVDVVKCHWAYADIIEASIGHEANYSQEVEIGWSKLIPRKDPPYGGTIPDEFILD